AWAPSPVRGEQPLCTADAPQGEPRPAQWVAQFCTGEGAHATDALRGCSPRAREGAHATSGYPSNGQCCEAT
ncbi:MAG: hypothetical protein KDB14_06035, partial [Planctomycetales bacterium]|nr:hypothetical protein [Planctomycetales bacterium]